LGVLASFIRFDPENRCRRQGIEPARRLELASVKASTDRQVAAGRPAAFTNAEAAPIGQAARSTCDLGSTRTRTVALLDDRLRCAPDGATVERLGAGLVRVELPGVDDPRCW